MFDGAATFRGTSLNKCLFTGPDLLTSLIGVLLCLREKRFALSGDIKGIFHQARVQEPDPDALRFLWRPPSSSGPPDIYQMQVQIVGSASSPTICSYVLRKAAADNEEKFPGLIDKVTRHCYMDNYMDCFDSETEAITLRKLIQLG